MMVRGDKMSIELPEAFILATQMDEELRGKRIIAYRLQDHERLQRIGMVNRDVESFNRLVNGEIVTVTSRGNVIRVRLNNGMNLILAPEYGGEIRYYKSEKNPPNKFHLKIDFDDNSTFTVRLTSMGIIFAFDDDSLVRAYVYRRDYNPQVPSPLDEEFTFQRFSTLLVDKNRMLKSVLVGKDAVVVGLSNSAFQDVLFRARLHPKRKASSLNTDERFALYDAIKRMLQERIRLKGKDRFYDFFGNQGQYTPTMGSTRKGRPCQICGTIIKKLSVGGGHVYFCPTCQV